MCFIKNPLNKQICSAVRRAFLISLQPRATNLYSELSFRWYRLVKGDTSYCPWSSSAPGAAASYILAHLSCVCPVFSWFDSRVCMCVIAVPVGKVLVSLYQLKSLFSLITSIYLVCRGFKSQFGYYQCILTSPYWWPEENCCSSNRGNRDGNGVNCTPAIWQFCELILK